MDIRFQCEKCQQELVIDETGAGMTIPCPKCETMLTVPRQSDGLPTTSDTRGVSQRESSVSSPRLFDLNIEQILENWEVCHALRELIANAIDEQVISKSRPIEIFKDSEGHWHVRDFGRGLRIDHLTLNECQEKLQFESGIIGKFGVGLKDALATLHRHGVSVSISSAHGQFSLRRASKHGFEDVVTLHVEYREPESGFQGTDVELTGVSDSDVALARSFFLEFSDEALLEETAYGQIIQRKGDAARIYINGVFAAEETNFLFAYNITSLTPAMRKKLNRERINVTRSLYSDRIKTILKSAQSKSVRNTLADQALLNNSERGEEMFWLEIAALASTCLHERQPVCFVTGNEWLTHVDLVNHMPADGLRVVVVEDVVKQKLLEQARNGGTEVRTLESYVNIYNDSFRYVFVEPSALTPQERRVFELTDKLFEVVEVAAGHRPPVRISETMRESADDTGGIWDMKLREIIIKRSELATPQIYARILLHEVAHAMTGKVDCTRDFENVLSTYLGKVAIAAIE